MKHLALLFLVAKAVVLLPSPVWCFMIYSPSNLQTEIHKFNRYPRFPRCLVRNEKSLNDIDSSNMKKNSTKDSGKPFVPSIVVKEEMNKDAIERADLRLQGFELYAFVGALLSSSSIGLLTNVGAIDIVGTINDMPLGLIEDALFVTTLAATLGSLYVTIVFSITALYGKSAIGYYRDLRCKEFMEKTGKVRYRGFQAFTASSVLFGMELVFLSALKLPPGLPRILGVGLLSGSVSFVWSEKRLILDAAAPMFSRPIKDDNFDKANEENSMSTQSTEIVESSEPSLTAQDEASKIILERADLRLQGLELYAFIGALLSSSSFGLLTESGAINVLDVGNDSTLGFIEYGLFVTTVAAAMGELYVTMIFSMFSLYAKSAIGQYLDNEYEEFMVKTSNVRRRGYQAFPLALALFGIELILLSTSKLPPGPPRIMCAILLSAIISFECSDMRFLLEAAKPIYESRTNGDNMNMKEMRPLSQENPDIPPFTDRNKMTLTDIERADLQLQGMDLYAFIGALLASASIGLLTENGTIDVLGFGNDVTLGFVEYGLFVTTVAASLGELYVTVIFSFFSLYAKSAIGLYQDNEFRIFMENTRKVRDRGYKAFPYALVLFGIELILLPASDLPPGPLRLLFTISSTVLVLLGWSEMQLILDAAKPIYSIYGKDGRT